jgi:hypothetical protein
MSYGKGNNTSGTEERPQSTMRRYVIAFNGPPGVGKDTASMAVCSLVGERAPWLEVRHMKMSDPLKKATHALFSAFHSPEYYDGEGRAQKDLACGDFLGMSPREAYISMSEEYAKKINPAFFGYIARKNMVAARSARLFVFSDAGFPVEWKPIIEYVGEENFLLVQLFAVGKDFSIDSRGYIGEELKTMFPRITVTNVANTFGDKQERELFRVFAQGAAINFLRHELREEEDTVI